MSRPTNIFRVHFAVAGGHVHCRLFCASGPDRTFASCGDFVVRRGGEFQDLLLAFGGAEFIGNDEGVGIIDACNEA